MVEAAKDAKAVLYEVAKAVHIDWLDDVSGDGYGEETAKKLGDALDMLEEGGFR